MLNPSVQTQLVWACGLVGNPPAEGVVLQRDPCALPAAVRTDTHAPKHSLLPVRTYFHFVLILSCP